MLRALTIAVLVLVPSLASAQDPAGGSPMPLATDLEKVRVGSWADYDMSLGSMPPMKVRMALVARKPGAATVETSMEGGLVAAAGGKMVLRAVVDPSRKNPTMPVKQLVTQVGPNDPMEMPPGSAQQGRFRKPDPKSLVGEETVKVGAGSFKTKHYREKTPQGSQLDYWISESAPPLGLVRMESDMKNTPQASVGPMKLELASMGKDAKPLITKAAKPFDESTLRKQLTGGGAGAPPPAAPAPTPPPPKK